MKNKNVREWNKRFSNDKITKKYRNYTTSKREIYYVGNQYNNARKELYSLVEDVNRYSEPALIVSKKGNAVLVSENDWNAIQETIYLNAIPGMVESIRSGMDTRLEDCVPEEDVEW